MSSRWFHLMSWDVWESVSPQYSGTFHTLYVCVLQFGERDYIQTIVQSVAHRQRKSALITETHDNNTTTTMISESDVTYGQVCWPILGICALHLTHSSAHTQQWTHTHREHTPAAVGTGQPFIGGPVPCSRAPRRGCTFSPSIYNPCWTQTRTHNLWITSPTL